MLKIESGNKFLTSIQSRAITLDFIDKIYPSTIPYHSFLISTLIQRLKKIGHKMLKIESGNEFITSIKAITLYLIDEIYPFTIPNHSFLISTLIQSLKKIGQKMLKIESGNEALTDRRMDGRTLKRKFLNGGYNIIPRTF